MTISPTSASSMLLLLSAAQNKNPAGRGGAWDFVDAAVCYGTHQISGPAALPLSTFAVVRI
jgi:hypothetical protein